MSYAQEREALYSPLRHVFNWDWLYGTEYALADIHAITLEFRQELAYATVALGKIYAKAAAFTQIGSDELLQELGFPPETWGSIRVLVIPNLATSIGRFDFASTPEGLKMLEFNSDTPTSVVEAFFVNGQVCAHFGYQNPNEGMERDLAQAFAQVLVRYQELGYPTDSIVFSSLGWHDEDKGTTQYLLDQSGLQGRFVPLEDLRVFEDRLWVFDKEEHYPIDVWYRLHALEKLAEELDEDSYPTGAHVLDLVARGKLALINPPSAFVAQTKAMQALIWGLHEAGEFFSPEEHQLIETYMLPTYLENRFVGEAGYVSKPVFGREGGAVSIFNAAGELLEKDEDELYWEQPMVYQKRVEMQEIQVSTLNGPYVGRLLWGSFLIGGQASAIAARIGKTITGNLSCFLPCGIRSQVG